MCTFIEGLLMTKGVHFKNIYFEGTIHGFELGLNFFGHLFCGPKEHLSWIILRIFLNKYFFLNIFELSKQCRIFQKVFLKGNY